MSNLTDVRTLISDEERYDRSVGTGNGVDIEFQTPRFPLVAASVVIYVNGVLQVETVDYTLDLTHGLIYWTAAPGVGQSITVSYRYSLFSDAQITTFLTVMADVVLLAAAMALDTMASNEAMVQKVTKLLDLSTNGAATAAALRNHANQLRALAQKAIDDADAASGFDIAEMNVGAFSAREIILNNALRGG